MKTKVKGRELTLGTDVEGTLWHQGIKKFIPCTAFNTPYTSEKRFEKYGRSYHRDNILIEYQTNVVETPEALVHEVSTCRQWLKDEVQKRLASVDVRYMPVVEFEDPAMVKVDEAAEMGCQPDHCGYDKEEKEGPEPAKMEQMRVGSGHIHIGGLEGMEYDDLCTLARFLDVYVGIECAFFESHHSTRYIARRRFYGQAGRFRVKPYGIEYRTTSNMWTVLVNNMDYRARVKAMLHAIARAVDAVDLGLKPEDYFNMENLRHCINATGYVIDNPHDWSYYVNTWKNNSHSGYADVTKAIKEAKSV